MLRVFASLLVLLGGCSARNLGDTMEAGSSDGNPGDDPGVRPHAPGSMYSACTDTSVCAPLEFYVFPHDEAGFCTAACGPGDDASVCDAAPGEDRTPFCMDIGLTDGRKVCALGCSGQSCPDEMRCEQVQAAGGGQYACF